MSSARDDRRSVDVLDDDTIDPSTSLPRLEPGLVPTLTLLLHPDVRRVGEQARLYKLRAGERVALSRLAPAFGPVDPAHGGTRPLADPAISRRPIWLAPADEGAVGIELGETGSRVLLDERPLDGDRIVPESALDRGVVLEVARRVVLLLHLTNPRTPRVDRAGLEHIIGENDAIERIRGEVRSVGGTDVPVLLRGETGTGKELLARAIHATSARAGRPFVSVNVAAVPPSTAASALFGHTRGAFTGALRDHAGFFQQADGGSLFLDEVGDTPPDVQVMLLRVLETGEVQRVGAQRHETVAVRLIAATDSDLQAATRAGAFRAPLLHRLSAYEIVAPPLRERRDDIARLLLHFVRSELRAVGAEARLAPPPAGGRPWLPTELVARVVRHEWPGNVRQLHNFARQLVISHRDDDRIDPRELIGRLRDGGVSSAGQDAASDGDGDDEPRRPYKRPSEIGDDELVEALRRNDFRPRPTARDLGISRTSLYVRIDRSDRIRKARDIGRGELLRCRDACRGDVDAMAARLEVSLRGLKLRLRELGLET